MYSQASINTRKGNKRFCIYDLTMTVEWEVEIAESTKKVCVCVCVCSRARVCWGWGMQVRMQPDAHAISYPSYSSPDTTAFVNHTAYV